jgi:hypothetical protein
VREFDSVNVTPTTPVDDVADQRPRDPVASGNIALAFSRCGSSPNLNNHLLGEFGVVVPLATLNSLRKAARAVVISSGATFRMHSRPMEVTFACAPLGNPVGNVVRMRPKKEMRRIDTDTVVAVMAYTHAIGDRPNERFIGDAMYPPRFSVVVEEPVSAVLRQAADEQSTSRIWLGHAQPLEPRFDALPHGLHYTRASDTNERSVAA